MANEIQPPSPFDTSQKTPTIFLAGSIEQGTAQPWQSELIRALSDLDCLLLNPRRDEWNAELTQSESNDLFREQVEWELLGLESSDIIAVYFDPNTKSPITLLELGLHAKSGKLIVCCPEGYWRKGNVDIVCKRYSIETVDNLDQLTNAIRDRVTGSA